MSGLLVCTLNVERTYLPNRVVHPDSRSLLYGMDKFGRSSVRVAEGLDCIVQLNSLFIQGIQVR